MSITSWGVFSTLAALATGITFALSLAMLQKSRLQALQAQVFAQTEASLAEFLIFLPPTQFWCLVAAVVLPTGFIVLFQFGPFWAVLVVAAIVLLLPWFRHLLHAKRCDRIAQQLPDVVLALANALAAGLALAPALAAVCPRLPQPIEQEFSLLNRRLQWGDSLAAGLADFYQRVPRGGVYQFLLVLTLAKQHGAQQVTVLQRLAKSLQQRIYAERRLRSFSAQARLQGRVMLMLPIGLFVVLQWVQPSDNALLLTTHTGQFMLALAAIMMLIGHLLVRQLIRTTPDD